MSNKCFYVSGYMFISGGNPAFNLFQFHRVPSVKLANDLQFEREYNLHGTVCISP